MVLDTEVAWGVYSPLVRSQYHFHPVLCRLLESGIGGGSASSKVTVDMRESKGQIMDSWIFKVEEETACLIQFCISVSSS